MEPEISKSQFKAKALEIFRHIEQSGESVVIMDHGRPVLVIEKYTGTTATPLKSLENSVVRYDDPFAPVDDASWNALK